MRFVLDQDVYAITARFLRDLDHDLVTAADLGASRAADEELLSIAHEHKRLFMTRDRDFGSLVFVKELGAGIIYLRILPSTVNAVHAELARVLRSYSGIYTKPSLLSSLEGIGSAEFPSSNRLLCHTPAIHRHRMPCHEGSRI